MLTATTRCETPNAGKYLQQLCKHFAHKVEVAYGDGHGQCRFSCGTATMNAGLERLDIVVEAADTTALTETKQVIESHLVRFAFRENLQPLAWRD
ncbi:MAG: DUF2218 domain-containing protein [Mesorhizobium sp.]|uniref:DUF2218 domain-containing protein n=1 Tax=unclassified Mesorhizobium TaxID=325217 RepID=UPI0004874CBF|nr:MULTISPECIES: DUF2218 domain-containing protein [unclassified Mesorhizobium]RWO63496.1 MAG: DUF2218 domain-containing protein [Mesorhizobium sp.]RWO92639.1 MAG: DUF2218 domain-containing protein [Mesorhizobium sp.]RWP27658.1 MAG: DUF2218 domain-containing protein [Mesorhizobium sp.]RWP45891.1 MAG: DUF2218 domain-containing protein [Mesorhizobium sp.]RWP61617.1 MAG: DUF2218 domain-containing protein [Mesorhizobium sp.]